MKTPKQIWNDVDGFIQDAVADVANCILTPGATLMEEEDEWAGRIRQARKDGVRDIRGWLADELYDDPQTIADLAGDRIYEECNGDRAKMREVYAVMETERGAVAQAAALLRRN